MLLYGAHNPAHTFMTIASERLWTTLGVSCVRTLTYPLRSLNRYLPPDVARDAYFQEKGLLLPLDMAVNTWLFVDFRLNGEIYNNEKPAYVYLVQSTRLRGLPLITYAFFSDF